MSLEFGGAGPCAQSQGAQATYRGGARYFLFDRDERSAGGAQETRSSDVAGSTGTATLGTQKAGVAAIQR